MQNSLTHHHILPPRSRPHETYTEVETVHAILVWGGNRAFSEGEGGLDSSYSNLPSSGLGLTSH